jgi:hypothetical protein
VNFQTHRRLHLLRIAADNEISTKNSYRSRLSDSICGNFLPNEG